MSDTLRKLAHDRVAALTWQAMDAEARGDLDGKKRRMAAVNAIAAYVYRTYGMAEFARVMGVS